MKHLIVCAALAVSVLAPAARAQVSTRASVYELPTEPEMTVGEKTGEALSGFPSWEERVIHQWMNRAGVPAKEPRPVPAWGDPVLFRWMYDFRRACSLFGVSASGEIIAGTAEPDSAFYMWLHESTANPTCNFTQENGHRWLILNTQGSVGIGASGRAVSDFAGGGVIPKVPSAAPLDAFVVVDGSATPMALGRGTSANGAYRATVSGMGTGCHRYYVIFRDALGASHRYPTRGTLGIGPASCQDWSGRPVHGDFSGDTRADVLLRNTATGANLLWTMNGTAVQAGAYAPSVNPAGLRQRAEISTVMEVVIWSGSKMQPDAWMCG